MFHGPERPASVLRGFVYSLEMIEADGIARLYRRGDDAVGLHGVSFRLKKGSVLGILGADGSGKTTLVRIIAALVRPTRGRATIGGVDVVDQGGRVRELVGYLPEKPAQPGTMTIAEYLDRWATVDGMSTAERRARIEDLLSFFDLTEVRSETVLDARVSHQRRMFIALALLADPPVLILDEPMVGLTDAERDALVLKLRALQERGKTILLTSIKLSDLQPICTHILTLFEGRSTLVYTTPVLLKKVGEAHHARVFIETDALPSVVRPAVQGVKGVLGVKEAGPSYVLFVEPGTFRPEDLRAALASAGIDPRSIKEASLTIGDIFRTFASEPAA